MKQIIAAQKLVEKALRHLAAIAEQTSEATAVLDLDGKVVFANHAWARIHGYQNPQELIGKNVEVFHTEEHMRTDVFPFIEETKQRGTLAGPIEHVRADGKTFVTHTKMVAVTDDRADAIGLVLLAADNSEQKRIEDELRKQCDRLRQKADGLSAELATANEKLLDETRRRRLAEEKVQQYRDNLHRHIDELTAELTAENPHAPSDHDHEVVHSGMLDSLIYNSDQVGE